MILDAIDLFKDDKDINDKDIVDLAINGTSLSVMTLRLNGVGVGPLLGTVRWVFFSARTRAPKKNNVELKGLSVNTFYTWQGKVFTFLYSKLSC